MSKILVIAPTVTTGRGGTESVLNYVFTSPRINNAHELKLLLIAKPQDESWPASSIDESKFVINSGSRLTFILKTFIFSKADFVICLGPRICFLASIIKKLFHKHYIILSWVHFSLFDTGFMNPKHLKYADGNLAISSQMIEQFEKLGIPADKVKVIYNPVQTVELKQQNYHQDANSFHLGYVGRLMLDEQKNFRFFVEVIKKLSAKSHVDVKVIGSGDNEEEVKQYTESELKDSSNVSIKWYGWLDEPWKMLNDIDMLALTSNFEGFPMVLIEAISRNIPVVSTDFPVGVRDIVQSGKNGEISDLGDLNAFVENIFKIRNYNLSDRENISKTLERLEGEKYDERFLSAISYFGKKGK